MERPQTQAKQKQQGFTLIELSIVLVIIGLIVGGVLVGQDLIKAAEIRATVSQVEKYNAAVNTFRTKYNAIPGDITGGAGGQAGAFGLYVGPGTVGQGDGNGLVEGGVAGGTNSAGENIMFWRHLTDANLVDGAFGVTGNSALAGTGTAAAPGTGLLTAAVTNVAQSLPPAKLGRGTSFLVYSNNGLNYYQIYTVTGITAPGVMTAGASQMTPTEAYNIDQKVDDGAPNTGGVRARGIAAVNANPTWVAATTAATCIMGGTAVTDLTTTYNRVAATGGNDPSCSLRLQFN